jgi:putative Mn2+ efflux pump MntP
LNPEAGKSIAAAFALSAFTVALMSGLAVDNPLARTLKCAVVSMLGCYFAGLAIGAVAMHVAADHVNKYKARNPMQGPGPSTGNPQGAGAP